MPPIRELMSPPNPHRVVDVDGRRWTVTPVIEGLGWDAELPVRRENWLSIETGDERRFISPLPPEWELWSEEELCLKVRSAPRSKRKSIGG